MFCCQTSGLDLQDTSELPKELLSEHNNRPPPLDPPPPLPPPSTGGSAGSLNLACHLLIHTIKPTAAADWMSDWCSEYVVIIQRFVETRSAYQWG